MTRQLSNLEGRYKINIDQLGVLNLKRPKRLMLTHNNKAELFYKYRTFPVMSVYRIYVVNLDQVPSTVNLIADVFHTESWFF